jgi:hypothetical protein
MFIIPPTYSKNIKLAGWWLTYPSEKYEFVSWDDDIPNVWRKKMFQTTNQPSSKFTVRPQGLEEVGS